MKKNKLTVVMTALFLISLPFVGLAQRGKPHPPKNNKLQEVKAFKGKIKEYTYNDDFIYDGFYLQSNKQTYYVKFPKHLGQQIRELRGNITVNGVMKYSRTGEPEIKMVNIQGSGKTVADVNRPRKPQTPPLEQVTSGSGKISEFKFNRKGEVTGYLLGNKTLLRVSPQKAKQLNQMMKTGQKIEFTGVEKKLKEGEVPANNYKIIYCQTISVNGIQYLVR